MKTIKVEVEVKEEIIENNLVAALEGGSNYWYEIVGYKNKKPQRKEPYWSAYITTPLSEDGVLKIKDNEGKGKVYNLTRNKLIKGLKVMANKCPIHFGEIMNEDGDATTGDVFLQCALFGEVIYG